MRKLFLTTHFLLLLVLSFIIFFIYLAIAYIVGGHHLIGGTMGNDAWSFISRMKILAEYFPYYPFWNPREGGGVTLPYAYPILTHTLLIITSKISGLTLAEAFKLWGFLSIPLFGFGVYIYGLVRLRNIVLAFLAGIFYILSPIAWIWILEWGFYAESVALIFFPFAILFFDLYITRATEGNWDLRTRVYFLFAAVLLGVSFLAHPTVFFGTVTFIPVYTFFYALLRRTGKVVALKNGIVGTMLLTAVAILLIAFYFIPFYHYSKASALGNTQGGGTCRRI